MLLSPDCDDIKGHRWTRRRFTERAITAPALALTIPSRAWGQIVAMGRPEPYSPSILPAGIRSRFVENVNGLRVHVLESGFGQRTRPCVLLLHGFPELAFSWRKVIPPLAAAGFHV